MRTPARLLLSTSLLVALGCSAQQPSGAVGACYASSADTNESDLFQLDRTHQSLVRVSDEDEREAPETFERCSAGMPARAQVVDGDGVHLWLAAEGDLGAREIVHQDTFDMMAAGASLVFRQVQGFTPTTTLALVDDDGPMLALQDQGALEALPDLGGLAIAPAGGTALTALTSCGNVTEQAVRFLGDDGDDGERTLANGQVDFVMVNGVEVHVANVFTVERDSVSCDDAPGSGATWVAVRGTL